MRTAALIFPHQLFKDHPVLREKPEKVLLIEDSLFFGDSQYPLSFHRQKLSLHKATLQSYQAMLREAGFRVETVVYDGPESVLHATMEKLAAANFARVVVADVHDFSLNQRLQMAAQQAAVELEVLPSPAFINSPSENQQWRSTRKRWHMADFYQWQRKRLGILMDQGKPVGGRWSFDQDNRKKIPKKDIPYLPSVPAIKQTDAIDRIAQGVDRQFLANPGVSAPLHYPTTHDEAERWLNHFLHHRFSLFGVYEDAMVAGNSWLYHSVLTPMLNIGLLTPRQVLDQALATAHELGTPLNSVEGFVRQLIGWREFMRATYDDLGVSMRNSNHWQHKNPLPAGFYTAQTGIEPIDDTIKRILNTGYCHHIERLMLVGGFLFLCEVNPDEIYRWFMEMFVDAYDWVMVPNVYAMSQHADGGSITTKPYFSGSNYILKMSNYQKGEWSNLWDALFWRWILVHKEKLAGNYRWAMMCKNADRMPTEKQNAYIAQANEYLGGCF